MRSPSGARPSAPLPGRPLPPLPEQAGPARGSRRGRLPRHGGGDGTPRDAPSARPGGTVASPRAGIRRIRHPAPRASASCSGACRSIARRTRASRRRPRRHTGSSSAPFGTARRRAWSEREIRRSSPSAPVSPVHGLSALVVDGQLGERARQLEPLARAVSDNVVRGLGRVDG
jgi:hypothetical protein